MRRERGSAAAPAPAAGSGSGCYTGILVGSGAHVGSAARASAART